MNELDEIIERLNEDLKSLSARIEELPERERDQAIGSVRYYLTNVRTGVATLSGPTPPRSSAGTSTGPIVATKTSVFKCSQCGLEVRK